MSEVTVEAGGGLELGAGGRLDLVHLHQLVVTQLRRDVALAIPLAQPGAHLLDLGVLAFDYLLSRSLQLGMSLLLVAIPAMSTAML
jgi:hypothetical protein